MPTIRATETATASVGINDMTSNWKTTDIYICITDICISFIYIHYKIIIFLYTYTHTNTHTHIYSMLVLKSNLLCIQEKRNETYNRTYTLLWTNTILNKKTTTNYFNIHIYKYIYYIHTYYISRSVFEKRKSNLFIAELTVLRITENNKKK